MLKSTLLAVITASLLVGTAQAQQPQGQGGGRPRFDPAQMQQRMMERYKETLEVTSDDDWKAISPLVEKVMTAQRESMMGRFGGMFGRGRGPGGPGGGPGGQGGLATAQDRPEIPGAMGELQKALDGKASNAELKTLIAKVADERKAKEASLAQAQESLRKVLSVRQEALAVVGGLLPPPAK